MTIYNHFIEHFNLQENYQLPAIYKAFAKIPYENATKIIRKQKTEKLRMPEDVFSEFLKFNTGGTCFSLVFALYKLLQNYKFDAYPVLADRYYGVNTHAAVLASEGQKLYLLDPGFLVPEAILLPTTGQASSISLPMGDLYFENFGETINVYTLRNNIKKPRYIIKNKRIEDSQFVSHWKDSFEFKMMDNLFMSKLTNESQIILKDTRLEIVTKDKREKFIITDNFVARVNSIFNIHTNIFRGANKMSSPTQIIPVKLFFGTIHINNDFFDAAKNDLEKHFGPTDFISEFFPFSTPTLYYEKEMKSTDLKKGFFLFKNPIDPILLTDAKNVSYDIEEKYRGQNGIRQINLDAGYIDFNKVILASYKYGSQKIYIGKNVFADPTLHYDKGKFTPFSWTFPDFKDDRYYKVLFEIRQLLKKNLQPNK